jgi:hypothetical protein
MKFRKMCTKIRRNFDIQPTQKHMNANNFHIFFFHFPQCWGDKQLGGSLNIHPRALRDSFTPPPIYLVHVLAYNCQMALGDNPTISFGGQSVLVRV